MKKLRLGRKVSWRKELYLTTGLMFLIGLLLFLQLGNLERIPMLKPLGEIVVITSLLMVLLIDLHKYGNENRVRKMVKLLFWSGTVLAILIILALLL